MYGPFLIIALIVVSHSPVLANYGRSIPDLVTMAVAVLIVTICGVALRLSAEATRAEARRRLTERLMIAKGESSGAQPANQLELLFRRIEELRECVQSLLAAAPGPRHVVAAWQFWRHSTAGICARPRLRLMYRQRRNAPQQKSQLFDHLVGASEQRRWHLDAERLRSLEIDH